MTGTGTQTDPYKVTEWEEFVSAVGEAGAYVELSADINMNDVSPGGVGQVNVKCAGINGSGHTISNLYFTGSIGMYITSVVSVSELELINIRGGHYCTVIWNAGSGTTFTLCRFSGFIDDNGIFLRSIDRGIALKRCSVNLQFSGTSQFIKGEREELYFCNVNMQGSAVSGTSDTIYCSNCLFTGILPKCGVWYWDDTIINAVIPTLLPFYGTPSHVLYNSDLVTDSAVRDGLDRFSTALTTEGLKNEEYLRAIGFPIGVD